MEFIPLVELNNNTINRSSSEMGGLLYLNFCSKIFIKSQNVYDTKSQVFNSNFIMDRKIIKKKKKIEEIRRRCVYLVFWFYINHG